MLRTAALAFFAVLTIAGDLILYLLPGESLQLVGLEVFGLRADSPSAWQSFAASRPTSIDVAAIVVALVSWVVTVAAIRVSHRADKGSARPRRSIDRLWSSRITPR